MHRRALFVVLIVTTVTTTGTESLRACGDKFIRIGRSARLNGYAAVHPSSILMFVPARAKPEAVREFGAVLRRAGHRFQTAVTLEQFSSALSGERVDIVIAGPSDAATLKPLAAAASSRPAILPVVHQPTREVLGALAQDYRHVLRLPASKHEALVEIDALMEARVGAPPAARSID